jgi:hypothetical protein
MNKRHWAAGLVLTGLLFLLYLSGICGCTLFAFSSFSYLAACSLMVGNQALGALTMEREKKTLDCLRLTQWTSSEVLRHKLQPELLKFVGVFVALAPSVLLSGLLGDAGLFGAVGVLALGAVSASAASTVALCLSSVAETTSQAYVWGRFLKASWLLLSPLFDRLVSAVFISTAVIPVFGTLNPLSSSWAWLMPESQTGFASISPWFTLISLASISLAAWKLACHRFETGMVSAPRLADRKIHSIYSLGSNWPQSLRQNPAFLREIAAQLRSGAGRWPGYAVFAVIFLAPLLYAQGWIDQDTARNRQLPPMQAAPISVVPTTGMGPSNVALPTQVQTGIALQSRHDYRVKYVLTGHKQSTCLRTLSYQLFHVPLPVHQLVKVFQEAPVYHPTDRYQSTNPSTAKSVEVQEISSHEAQEIGAVGLPNVSDSTTRAYQPMSASERLRRGSAVGLSGGVCLLLVYLAIRGSGFLATCVTGERERSTWQDLQLSGISAADFLSGKVYGALAMPMVQMTVAFPCLLVFAGVGSLSIFSIVGLWLYALVLARWAAVTGAWCSAAAKSSHNAQTSALIYVALFFVLGLAAGEPGVSALAVGAYILLIGLAGRGLNSSMAPAAATMMCVGLLCPSSISPLTTVVQAFGLPSLGHQLGFGGQQTYQNAATMFAQWATGMTFMLAFTQLLWNSSLQLLSHGADSTVIQDREAA